MKQKLWLARLFGIGMFLALLSLNSLLAQGTDPTIKWKRIGPWGGDIRDIKIKRVDSVHKYGTALTADKDSIIVASYGAGVFIADSIASNYWKSRNFELPTRKVLSLGVRQIGFSDTMYVGLEGYGVFKTFDAGCNWKPAYGTGVLSIKDRSVYAIAVHPNTSWVLYAATDQGLWKSTNSGATWNQVADIPTNQLCSDVAIHEYATGKVYASSGLYVYRSTDNGNDGTWSQLTLTDNTSPVNCLSLAFSNYDTVFAGTNDGKVYEITYPPPTYTYTNRVIRNDANFPVYSIAINPSFEGDINGSYAAIGYYRIKRCADTLYLGTRYGFIQGNRMSDNNYAWTVKNDNALINYTTPGTGNTMIQTVCFYRGFDYGQMRAADWVIVGTGFNGVYRMDNTIPGGGQTFSAKNDSLTVGGLRVVSVSPITSDLVYTAGGYGFGGDLANGDVWKSANASSSAAPTWTRVLPIPDSATMGHVITSITQSYISSNVTWVADSLKGIYKTTNGGNNWTLFYAGTGVSYLHVRRWTGSFTSSLTADSEIVYAAQKQNGGYKILKSYKGGAFTAMSQTFNYPITSIITDSGSTQKVYVSTYGDGVWSSADSGATFTHLWYGNGSLNPKVFSLAVDSINTYIIAGTEAGIFYTTNGGTSWIDDNTGATAAYGLDKVYNVYCQRDTIWAVLSEKGIFYRTKSGTGGLTKWTQANLKAWYFKNGPNNIPTDSLMMRDFDGIYKWDHDHVPTPNVGYAVSEIQAVFRRTAGGDLTLPILNGTFISGAGNVYVYIPDSISAVRGEYCDIPIRILNASSVDSFNVTIHVPSTYFTDDTPTPGVPVKVVTVGTLCDGKNVTFTHNLTDVGQTLFQYTSSTPFSTNVDTVLFKVRYKVVATQSLWDSLPRYSNVGDSSIHLVSGHRFTPLGTFNGGAGITLGATPNCDSTDFLWRTTTDSNKTMYGSPNVLWLAKQNTTDSACSGDSSAIFWLRKLPDDGTSDNGLAGDSTTNELEGVTHHDHLGDVGNALYYTHLNLKQEKDWKFAKNTGRSMQIWVKPSAYPTYPYLTSTLLPELTIRTGDAIGAFYYRNDTLVCAGWGTWKPDTGCVFTVWGDDDKTPLKDGFVENEKLIFKIYDSRYKKVWPVPSIYTYCSSGYPYFVNNVSSEFDQMFKGKQLIKLFVDGGGQDVMTAETKGGWHLISSYLYPVDPGPEVSEIFKYFDYFFLLKDQDQNVYWPQWGLDQIINWDIKKAYWVYFLNYATNFRSGLESGINSTVTPTGALRGRDVALFRGTRVDPTKYAINLVPSWNLIPYLGNKSYAISTALASISGKFKLVKTDSGTIYWPETGINQIGNMGPNTSTSANPGYMIYMNQAATLTYPAAILSNTRSMNIAGSGIPELASVVDNTPHYAKVRVSPNSQVIAIEVSGMTLKAGDEVGIYNNKGILVGSGVYNKNSKNAIGAVVYGTDEMSAKDGKYGASENENLIVKIYTKTDGQELKPDVVSVNWMLGDGAGLTYKSNSAISAKVSLTGKVLPTEYALEQNYPNPFNPTTTIKYALPDNGIVKIKVYDILGREVKALVNENQVAGYYSIEWNGTDNRGLRVASGVYMYRIEANNFKKTVKMMLMK